MSKRSFQDTMISAKNFGELVKFYTQFVGLQEVQKTESFVLLKDANSGQSLCITDGASVGSPSPGVSVGDLEEALMELESLGGKIIKRWDYGAMRGANCQDPEGNEIMLWHTQQ